VLQPDSPNEVVSVDLTGMWTIDVASCGVGGNGRTVDCEDRHYKPPLRIPRDLRVHTAWLRVVRAFKADVSQRL
jgi:hypothetical protein